MAHKVEEITAAARPIINVTREIHDGGGRRKEVRRSKSTRSSNESGKKAGGLLRGSTVCKHGDGVRRGLTSLQRLWPALKRAARIFFTGSGECPKAVPLLFIMDGGYGGQWFGGSIMQFRLSELTALFFPFPFLSSFLSAIYPALCLEIE